MNRFYLFFLGTLLFALSGFSQTSLITASDGGFENTTPTFAANGWTVVNTTANNAWYVGAVTFSTGSKAAYIDKKSTAGTANAYAANSLSTSHFYRDIAIPIGGTNITLSFQLKGKGEVNYDRLLIYTAPTTITLLPDIPASPGTTIPGATLIYTQVSPFTSYTTQTVTLPNALAGTTFRLIFTWQNDVNNANQPPAAVDDISLTYVPCIPPAITSQPPTTAGICAGNSATFSAGTTGNNLKFQWKNSRGKVNDGNSITGTNTSTITFDPAKVGHTDPNYFLVASNGCGSVTSTSIDLIVTPFPAEYNVTGGGSYCTGSATGLDVGLDGSETNANYQLYRNDTILVGDPITGTGGKLDFGLQPAGTYTVIAFDNITSCSFVMTGNPVITESPLPQGTLKGNNTCTGGTPGQLTFTASSGIGPFTVIYNDGINPDVAKTGVTSGTAFNVSPNPTVPATYTIVSVSDDSGCVRTSGFSGGTAIIAISPSPAAPTGTDGTKCGTGTVTISATPLGSDETINWFATAAGGSVLSTGTNFTTPSISSTTTYYAEAINNSIGCISVSRTSVTAYITSTSVPPTNGTDTTICGPASAAISATPPSGSVIDWYGVATGGTVLPGGSSTSSFITPINSVTTSYYAEARSAGCVSNTRLKVTVTINPQPQGAFNGNSICAGGNGLLTYTSSNGIEPFTIVYNDGIANRTKSGIVSGATFSPFDNPASTTNYVLISITDTTGCSRTSDFTEDTATIIVNSSPTILTTTPSSRCGSGPVILRATASNGGEVKWYSSATGSTVSGTGNTFNTPGISVSTTYYAEAMDTITGCISTGKTPVIATINSSPVITTQPVDQVGCIGGTINFTAIATANAETYQWRKGNSNLTDDAHFNGSATSTLTINSLTIADQDNNYYLVITNGNGCSVSTDSVSLTVNQQIEITSQPVDRKICAGTTTTFAVTTTGGTFTYQWKNSKGNLTDSGNISGVTTPTLTITSATSANQDSGYYVEIRNNCGQQSTSEYHILTVSNSRAAPSAPPKFILFPTVYPTSVIVSFNGVSDATNYLIIVKNSRTAPAAPVNGIFYTGSGTLGGTNGRVDYRGTLNYATSTGLSPNTTYYYWVYAYNTSICGTSPIYNSTALFDSVITASNAACGTGTRTTLYWAGEGGLSGGTKGVNFNTASNWSYTNGFYTASSVTPTSCNDIVLALKGNTVITLTENASVHNMTYTMDQGSSVATLNINGKTLTINGDAVIDVLSGNQGTTLGIGEYSLRPGIIDFKANVNFGATIYNGINFPVIQLRGNASSKFIFRGDVTIGYTTVTTAADPATIPGTMEFDAPGAQQITWNNRRAANFNNVVIGNENNPIVRHVTGSSVPDNILSNLTINGSSILDLGQGQWNRDTKGGTFTMNSLSKLLLANNSSLQTPKSPGKGVPVQGSNFPGGYLSLKFSPTSTIEYRGDSSKSQRVYDTARLAYGRLVLTNGSGVDTADKYTAAGHTITVRDVLSINSKVRMTMGANIISSGNVYVENNATLVCGLNEISGIGTFNLERGGNLWIGSPAGISAMPESTGNITTIGGRNFNTAANYIYYGSGAINTGSGLPQLVNDLTINNNSGIIMYAASKNYTVAGTLTQVAGPLFINGDTLTINNLVRNSGTFMGSPTSSLGLIGVNKNTSLFFTPGARVLKHLFLNTNATAVLGAGERLDITGGADPGSVTVGAGSVLTTHDSLGLKSDSLGTARVGPIPQDTAGNALGSITGNVSVERYYPGRRAWRLVTAPVSTTRTIYNEWQIGGKMATSTPGSGTFITKPSGTGFLDDGLDSSTNYSLKTFDQSSGLLVNIKNTKMPISGNLKQFNVPDNIGYFIFIRGDRTPSLLNPYPITNYNTTTLRDTGALQTGKKTFGPVAAGDFMLIGNPYASPIDFGSLTRMNIPRKFWAWDPRLNATLGAYVLVDGQAGPGYIITPAPDSLKGTTAQDSNIQSSQAFFVQAATSGAGSVTFNESCKAFEDNNTVFRPALSENTKSFENLRVNLYLKDSDTSVLADGVYEQFHSDFSSGIDDLDGLKFTNFLENFGVSSNGKTIILERRPPVTANDTIFFKLWNTTQRNYQFRFISNSLNHLGLEGFLEDTYTKTSTPIDLNGYTNISFNINADTISKQTNRFKLVFKPALAFTLVTAYQQRSHINVEWKVSNETNIKEYEVERSSDGIHFTKAGSIAASNKSAYQWPDENVAAGTYYYRIRSISNNGNTRYSNSVKVTIEKNASVIAIYPNPIRGSSISLQLIYQPKGRYGIRLMNKLGQVLMIKQIDHEEGSNTELLPLSKTLSHGTYHLEVTKPDYSKTNIEVLY